MTLRVVLALLALAFLSAAAPRKAAAAPPPSADIKRAFEKLKSLEGKWSATRDGATTEAIFDAAAGRTAVMQRSGLVGIYFPDAGGLMLLVFNENGTQSKLRSAGLPEGAAALKFELAEVWNKAPGVRHVVSVTLRFVDDDNVVQTFSLDDGGKASSFEVRYARTSANTLK